MKVETYKHDYWQFALRIQTPYEYYDDTRHCLLNIGLFNWSWWITIPELFAPRKQWCKFSTPPADGREGYWDYTRREYGFMADKEALHIHYGIQPGSWSRNDPENSDHSKVYFWPWHPSIVRWDLLLPNGDVYHRNTYPLKKGQSQIGWYDVFNVLKQSSVEVEAVRFVKLTHYTKDGTEQIAIIKLTGTEREWRPRWTSWLPFFKIVQRCVECDSDVELGEKAGSWKGGLMGWSCEWKHDETMEQAFWRWYAQWNGK